MTAEMAPITSWTLMEEIPIPQDIGPILVQGERPISAFKTFRDSAIFTDRRLIVRDAQGLRGKKVELYSLPYSSINMWSSSSKSNAERYSCPKTACAMSWSRRRISMSRPSLTLMCPARVHSSSSALKSRVPAFSDDHMLIDEYGSE